jgi:hypothetical protein
MRLYFGDRLPDQPIDPDEPPDDTQRFLCKRKANYSAKDYRRFTYRNGVFIPDSEEAEAPPGMVESIRRDNAERAVLAAVRWLAERKLVSSHHKQSHKFLPKLMEQHDLLRGCTKTDVGKAMARLIGDKRVAVDVRYGTNSARHPVVGLGIAEGRAA